ncbi:Uncharacterised protein [Raoultella terrigena]|uniref:Uncharacterized protein n=1 Tax=Raoultella terrigena TaxID=577 RepID=A0A3P8M1G7_RAOTE|nr:Uncharacterised protein [Raoultella terrigena]
MKTFMATPPSGLSTTNNGVSLLLFHKEYKFNSMDLV